MELVHQQIVDHCFETAQEMLALNGTFIPNGAFPEESGLPKIMGIELDLKHLPNNGEIISMLEKHASDCGLPIYAIAFEVSIQLKENEDPTDAICVKVYGVDYPTFYQPFKINDEELNFEDIFAVK